MRRVGVGRRGGLGRSGRVGLGMSLRRHLLCGTLVGMAVPVVEDHRFDCAFGGAVLVGRWIRFGGGVYPVVGAQAAAEQGDSRSRMTATRVVGGAVLLGPVGAVLGGMARKGRSRCYVAVVTRRGSFTLSDSVRRFDQALRFASSVNGAAEMLERLGPGSAPAGWYPDPTDGGCVCWWDGRVWWPESKRPR